MNIRVLVNVVSPLMLSALLAACAGGGGGSSAPVSPGGGGPTTHATLSGGFAGIGRGGSSSLRSTQALAGSLVPLADFVHTDAYYTSNPGGPTGATAVGYYDPAAGAVPSPLPTITWSESGIAATIGAPQTPATLSGVSIAGQTFLSAPTVDGQGTITGTASNGDKVALSFLSYRGGGMSSNANLGAAQCVSFANGVSTPNATTGDLCLTTDGSGVSSVIAKLGALLVTKTIDQITMADAATLPSASTTITSASIVAGTATYTIILHAASGGLVKWEPTFFQGFGTTTGHVTDFYGPYRIAASGQNWDF
jgi:hypothetical protein